MMIKLLLTLIIASLTSVCFGQKKNTGQTEICKWQYGRNGAVSITYDDASVNQFKTAIPIMNKLNLPGTFYIMTGQIPGSQYQGKFIGRPVKEIIRETASIPTNSQNFFERASAAGFLGFKGTLPYHSKAGALYESGKVEAAHKHIDELYTKVRNGELEPGHEMGPEANEAIGIGWDDFKSYAAQGHEIASHTVTHPRLAVLDEVNMLYELEKSKEDLLEHIGPESTFSFEGPYGTENERVMQYMYEVYPASRNRMPAPYLEELNRSNKKNPGASDKEYVQWQRGPLSKTPLSLMKSWADTLVAHDNIWLVLVFHGVDDVGWEALPHEVLEEYFQYIKKNENKLWVATFADVTKYMRERMNAKVDADEKGGNIQVKVSHSLDNKMYNIPLTLKTYVSPSWKAVKVKQGNKEQQVRSEKDTKGTYILYQAVPNIQPVELSKE